MISVGGTAIKNFRKDFTLDGEIIPVEFVTMNCVEKQLYQLYFPHEGKTIRIHMQRNEKGDFRIMGEGVCPPKFLPLEAEFDAAIKNY
jgi:hypothetical protein